METITNHLKMKWGKGNTRVLLRIKKNYDLYLILLPPLLYYLIFKYGPMYGVQIAFRKFIPSMGITGSPWVGLENFIHFFNSSNFWTLLKNTFSISAYNIIVMFPASITLAVMINELRHAWLRKLVQTVTFAPYFISEVIMVGMILLFLSPQSGIINHVIKMFGGNAVYFMGQPEWFKTIYVLSNLYQNVGWGAVIYIATLSSVDTQLYDAAVIDGCSKLQRIWNIDIPFILPIATILLIMDLGKIMNVGFQKILLMQNTLNLSASDVIQTYVYRIGLINAQYSYSAAIGLFNNIINLVLLVCANRIIKKMGQTTLW